MNKSDNPYINAKREFLELFGDMVKAKHNWQVFSLIEGIALIVCILGLVMVSNKSLVIPYVVEVDQLGRAISVNVAKEEKINDERIFRAFIFRYIDMARSVISDAEAQRRNLDEVYKISNGSVRSNFLNKFYEDNNPFEFAKKNTKQVEFLSFLRQAENSYIVEWKEVVRNFNNEVVGTKRYKAFISIVQLLHKNKTQIVENPLNPFGIYVTNLSWSDLTGGINS